MSQIFTVFLPNKQRYRLEISKSTPLYQGLEQVCLEKGYVPAYNYAFRYNKAYPDLSTPVGILNLSNLVELELVPADEVPAKKSGSDAVSIGLQYGPQRHIEAVSCDTSLWDIISHFSEKHPGWIPDEPPAPDQHPVLVYTRHEVPGAVALRHTSPRQIGLAPGGAPALLRLLYRPVPPEKLAAASQLAESREKASAVKPASQPDKIDASTENYTSQVSSASTSAPITAAADNATHSSSSGPAGIDESNANLFSPFRQVPAWTESTGAEQNKQQAVKEPRTLAEALNLPDFDTISGTRAGPSRGLNEAASSVTAVAQYGPDRPFKFPEETAGQDLYRNELAEVRPAEFAACDRRLCAYLAGSTGTASRQSDAEGGATAMDLEEPDDSFFNVTESDLRKMAADLKRKVEEQTNEQLLTRQQREQQREDLYSCYEHTVIRLFFPDRRVVQSAFRPRETVHALYKFVREQLIDDRVLAVSDFYLYTTPPKKEITDMAQFLIHADLVPMPIVHVGFRKHLPDDVSLLKPEILNLVSSRDECDKVALACMKSAVAPIYAKQQQQQQPPSSGSTAASGPDAKRAANMVPKWFKK